MARVVCLDLLSRRSHSPGRGPSPAKLRGLNLRSVLRQRVGSSTPAVRPHFQKTSACYAASAPRLCALSEADWDLGRFAAVLQCSHLDTRLLQQQSKKKLYGTKNNCVHVQWTNSEPKRYKETKKNPTATFEEAGAKIGCREQKQGPEHAPSTHTATRGEGKTPKSQLQPYPWTHPYTHPI